MNIDAVALAVIDALDAEGIRYILSGSLASNFYGIPRSTQDIDFVVEYGQMSAVSLGDRLGPEFQLEPQMAFEAFTGTTKTVLRVRGAAYTVELFRLSDDPHDQERFRRRREVALLGRRVFLPTAEDVIVTKLRWLRPKDRDDIRGVVAVQGHNFDWDYVYAWCERHGTTQALNEIRASIPPI